MKGEKKEKKTIEEKRNIKRTEEEKQKRRETEEEKIILRCFLL